jgi:pimeloyl-ACP methyl ester carboxylesterase
MDYRGHHNSDMPDDQDTVNRKQFAKDLSELLEYKNIKKVILVGHSLGAQVSLEFVKKNPEMVKALILAHGTAGNPCETIFRSNISEVIFDPLRKVTGFFPNTVEKLWKAGGQSKLMQPVTLKFVHYSGFHPTLIDPTEVKDYVKVAGTFSWKLFTQLLNEMRSFRGVEWLHEVNQPTMIISGDMDFITPPINQEIMHQLMPNSKLLNVPSGSHCAQMDRPGFVNRAIKEFLNSL